MHSTYMWTCGLFSERGLVWHALDLYVGLWTLFRKSPSLACTRPARILLHKFNPPAPPASRPPLAASSHSQPLLFPIRAYNMCTTSCIACADVIPGCDCLFDQVRWVDVVWCRVGWDGMVREGVQLRVCDTCVATHFGWLAVNQCDVERIASVLPAVVRDTRPHSSVVCASSASEKLAQLCGRRVRLTSGSVANRMYTVGALPSKRYLATC